jgi:hypothetical protein
MYTAIVKCLILNDPVFFHWYFHSIFVSNFYIQIFVSNLTGLYVRSDIPTATSIGNLNASRKVNGIDPEEVDYETAV